MLNQGFRHAGRYCDEFRQQVRGIGSTAWQKPAKRDKSSLLQQLLTARLGSFKGRLHISQHLGVQAQTFGLQALQVRQQIIAGAERQRAVFAEKLTGLGGFAQSLFNLRPFAERVKGLRQERP